MASAKVKESARTTDYARAVKLLQRKLAESAGGKSACPERVYMSALLQLAVDDYRRNDRADLHETEQRVVRLMKPAFGHLRPPAFTTKALDDYIRQRQQLGRKNGKGRDANLGSQNGEYAVALQHHRYSFYVKEAGKRTERYLEAKDGK